MLLRWAESADAGMTVTMKLDDGPDGYQSHPLKGLRTGKANGQRFAMVLVPIGDDEKPAAGIPVTEQDQQVRRRWEDMKPSQQMGIACNDPAFIRWLGAVDEAEAADMVRTMLSAQSRSEADTNHTMRMLWKATYDQFVVETRMPERR